MPHSQIHGIPQGRALASPDPRNQRRRRDVRYERAHAMDLSQTDRYEPIPEVVSIFAAGRP